MRRIEWITDPVRLASIREQWDALARDEPTPFARHAWYSQWWASFHAGRAMQVCAAWEGDALVAALPLCGRLGRLEAMANVHTPVFAVPARDPEALRCVMAAALGRSEGALELTALDQRGAPARELAGVVARHRWVALTEAEHTSPMTSTRGSMREYRNRFKGRWRELERRRRKMAREHEMALDAVVPPRDLDGELARGLTVEASGWKGRAGTAIASDAQTLGFYRGIARAFHASSELRLSSLALDGRLVAFDLALMHGGRYWLLKTGYDEGMRNLGPGLVLRLAVIERCFEEGLEAHEFLGDDLPYKRLFSTDERHHIALRAYRRRPLPLARYGYRRSLRPALKRARGAWVARRGWPSP